jgi:hypothetical protein
MIIETLPLQKLRMLQIQGVEGEAVVCYREPLTTQEMQYPRLSQRVKNMAFFYHLWMSVEINSRDVFRKRYITC